MFTSQSAVCATKSPASAAAGVVPVPSSTLPVASPSRVFIQSKSAGVNRGEGSEFVSGEVAVCGVVATAGSQSISEDDGAAAGGAWSCCTAFGGRPSVEAAAVEPDAAGGARDREGLRPNMPIGARVSRSATNGLQN